MDFLSAVADWVYSKRHSFMIMKITNTLAGFLLLGILSCSKPSPTFHMPAEWEPHDAIWLGWEGTYLSYHPVAFDIIRTLTPHVQVKMVASSDSLLRIAKTTLTANGIDTTTIQFYSMPRNRYWIRDHGAAFLINEKGELGVADFEWNSYGYPGWINEKYNNNSDSIHKYLTLRLPRIKQIGQVDSLMAVTEGAVIQKVKVKHEGGAIEVNGKGTLILCEATVFQRNPDLSREVIEDEFKRGLGVTNVIWMKRGLADDPKSFVRRIVDNYVGGGTGGHTDEFVRFANPSTVMLAWVDEKEKDLNPINRMNYERMKENYDILSHAKDQDGRSLTIIKVPLPDLITLKVATRYIKSTDTDKTYDVSPMDFKASEAPLVGDTMLRVPAASYMNYLVTNGIVLLPSYVHMGSSKTKEEEVKAIFEKQFPDRKIVFINAMPINWMGGGIHCSTQQQPRAKTTKR